MHKLYRNYWTSRKRLQTETASVSKWDIWNKTKFESKVEKGLMTSAEVAELLHKDKKNYCVSLFEDERSDLPAVFSNIMLDKPHMDASFMDDIGREYLSYLFSPSKKKFANSEFGPETPLMFLREVWYNQFIDDEGDERESYIHFVFDEDGNVNARVYDERNKRTIDYEGKAPIDVSGLYEPLPEFGEYEGLARLERGVPFDLVKG